MRGGEPSPIIKGSVEFLGGGDVILSLPKHIGVVRDGPSVRNSSLKYVYLHFEFAQGQRTKISTKYKNPLQDTKISPVSTPILVTQAAF